MANQMPDPYNFLFDHSHVSTSQEAFLRDLSFGERSHHSPSPASVDTAPPSNAVVTVSPPASQHPVRQDVSLTPPGNTSIPSFCDQPRVATEGDVHGTTPGLVDLGMDSGLGLSEIQLTQKVDVDVCSHGARRNGLGEIRVGRFDGMNESPLEKPNLGIDSSGGCVEIESQKVKEGVVEDSGMEKKSDEECMLPGFSPLMVDLLKIAAGESECLKNAASEVEFGNSLEKKNVFDVLRFLSENSDKKEENLNDITLCEVAEACGVTFPRPRWWPEGENFDP